MRIINPAYEILPRDGARGNIGCIELAARTCYKTEDAIREGSADRIVSMLIERQHAAMLEHGDYIFMLDSYALLDDVAQELRRIEKDSGHRIRLAMTGTVRRPIISGNVRAWRELMATGTYVKSYFAGKIDPVYIGDLIPESARTEDDRVHPIGAGELKDGWEQRVHLRQTVRFTVDRGVTHEFVRHREMSFAQESTRYCNYSKDKFGREITVIRPCFLTEHTEPYDLWKRQCMSAETAYFALLNMGLLPQEARAVLPTSTKADLIVTGTLEQWNRFFDLRARQITGLAHPQAAEVAFPLMREMAARFPTVFNEP